MGLASDSDRDRAAASLGDHFARGRLTLDEFTSRVALALRARTHRELRRSLADLPASSGIARLLARGALLVLATGLWAAFSLGLLLVLAIVVLAQGVSGLELLAFLVVWLVPTFLLSRSWWRTLSGPFRSAQL